MAEALSDLEGGDAIAALGQVAGEATFDRTVDMVTMMMTEPDLRDRLRARMEAEIAAETPGPRGPLARHGPVVLGPGRPPDWPVHTFVTLGSPLAVPMVFDRLEPAPVDGQGAGPARSSAG